MDQVWVPFAAMLLKVVGLVWFGLNWFGAISLVWLGWFGWIGLGWLGLVRRGRPHGKAGQVAGG